MLESLSEALPSPVMESPVYGHRGSYPDLTMYPGVHQLGNTTDGRATPTPSRQGAFIVLNFSNIQQLSNRRLCKHLDKNVNNLNK